MNWIRSVVFLGVTLAALVIASAHLPVAAEESLNLNIKYTVGLRRTADVARKYTEIREFTVGDEVATRLTKTFTRDLNVHEWYTDLKDGNPSRFVRSYQGFDRKLSEETWIQLTDNTLKTEKEPFDQRKGQIITLDRAADGKLSIVDGANLMNDKAKAATIADVETDLLPHATKKVGDTWTIAGAAVEDLMDAEDSVLIDTTTQTLEEGELTCKLDSVGGGTAFTGAKVTFEGTLKFRRKKQDTILDQEVTNWVMEATVSGDLMIDISKGRLIERTLKATFKNSGTIERMAYTGSGTLEDVRKYVYSHIIEAAPDNGVEAPGKTTEVKTFAGDKVSPEHLVLALNGPERKRLVVFDPATNKQVRVLAIFPNTASLDHIALAPSRDRLAFSSTLNNEISHAPWNVFVLEIGSGKINQITPSWATGDGLAQAFTSAGKGRVIGRAVWSDNERGTSRGDNFSGNVHIDQTNIRAVVAIGGAFALDNVPAGMFALARVTGKVTARRLDGKDDGRTSANWSGSSGGMVEDGKTLDLGTITLQPVQADMVFCNSTWNGDTLTGSLYGFGWVWDAGYPKRSWTMPTKDMIEGDPISGIGYCNTGALLSGGKNFMAVNSGLGLGGRVRFLDTKTRKVVETLDPTKLGIEPEPAGRGTWRHQPTSGIKPYDYWTTGGLGKCRSSVFADMPLLYGCYAQDVPSCRVIASWPEFTGRHITDITTGDNDAAWYGSKTAHKCTHYLLIQTACKDGTPPKSNLYLYREGMLERLTSLDDVQSVSNTGR